MKLLFENWRKYMNERWEDSPTSFEIPDIGESFPRIDVKDIVENPSKNPAMKIALLNIFNKLEQEAEEEGAQHWLFSLHKMSCNSPDFNFDSREKALKFYKTPYKFKTKKTDEIPTKSLQDWHEHLKIVNSSLGNRGTEVSRSEKIDQFYSSGTRKKVDEPWAHAPTMASTDPRRSSEIS